MSTKVWHGTTSMTLQKKSRLTAHCYYLWCLNVFIVKLICRPIDKFYNEDVHRVYLNRDLSENIVCGLVAWWTE